MTTTPATSAELAAAITRANQIGDPLHLVLALWLDSWAGVDLSDHGPMPEDAQHALAVARQVLGTVTAPPEGEAPLRDRIAEAARDLGHPQWDADELATAVLAVLPAPVDRAAILRERAEFFEGCIRNAADPEADPRYWSAIHDVAMGLRRLADEAQQPTDGEAEAAPYPPEVQWIAQELEGGDEWMQLASGADRGYVEGRLTSYRTRSPHGLTTRLIRVTTTYTVEQPALAGTEEAK